MTTLFRVLIYFVYVNLAVSSKEFLSNKILVDDELIKVLEMARELLKSGFNAGGDYAQVWIRDANTFLEVCADVVDHSVIRSVLLDFFMFQNETDGNIPDNYNPMTNITVKNTVESDQETSLVQAVYKYINVSGDTSILQEIVNGITVLDRIEFALQYLLKYRYSEEYGLIWGATTIDWGDCQPEDDPGILFDFLSHPAIDIYDNSMFIIAIKNYLTMLPNGKRYVFWSNKLTDIMTNTMKYLWDDKKFIPHIYLEKGSPFPADFNEQVLYYQGGTTVAIEAGLLNNDQIFNSFLSMIRNKLISNATTIGMTIYPPYPTGYFKNHYMPSYSYQNAGDWTWFGARMIQQLVEHGFVQEGYQEIIPMVKRVIENKDFYEWYSVPLRSPRGSNNFRGSAGVLGKAIKMLLKWAESTRKPNPEEKHQN